MNDRIEEALRRGTSFLMAQSHSAGCFEGELSSSTFPTCAYAWVQIALGKFPDSDLVEWLLHNQHQDGTWSLDVSNQPNRGATLFAKLILQQVVKRQPTPQVETALARIPDYPHDLALVKLAYAAFEQSRMDETDDLQKYASSIGDGAKGIRPISTAPCRPQAADQCSPAC